MPQTLQNSDAGSESVGDWKLGTVKQTDLRLRDDEMEKAGLAADRAVAIARFDLGGRQDFESHLATVAPAGMFEPIAVRTNLTPY
jgi:hypothetical protein